MGKSALVFSSSDAYALLLGVALCSIFENRKSYHPFDVFVIDGGISSRNQQRLNVLEKRYGFTITYLVPDKHFFENLLATELPQAGYYLPVEVYYRLAIGRILPKEYSRALYLDCDIVVKGDLAELLNFDLEDKVLGAVADCFQDLREKHLKRLCQNVGLTEIPKKLVYFNSGILLVDLNLWRKKEIETKLFSFISKNSHKLWAADQDALNIVLLYDFRQLPDKYNFIAEQASGYQESNPFIIHFAGGSKPWYFFSALPYQSEYLYYASKTPWKNRKYRKPMDIFFAKKYHIYQLMWGVWSVYKKIKKSLAKI